MLNLMYRSVIQFEDLWKGSGSLDQIRAIINPMRNGTHPYGIDPVFLPSSELYQSDIAPHVEWYYNESDPYQVRRGDPLIWIGKGSSEQLPPS